MHPLAWTVLLTVLFQCTSAFYPYIPPESDDPSPTTKDRRAIEPRQGSEYLRMPIRRTPVKRDNRYNIVSAEPPTQTDSIGVHQDGSDFSYFSTFKFGTSEEDYHLLIDSGASNTWVMSSECETEACEAHNTFGSTDSTSLQASDKLFNMTYGTGSVDGRLASDDIRFAEFTVPMTFGLATNVSAEFLSYPMDGILGLGRPGETSVGTSALLEVLVAENLIPAKFFGIHLSRTADGENDGELNFGAPNPDRYDGDLSYTSAVEDTGFWEIPIENAGVDGNALSFTGRTAIIDSGTSFVLMPEPDAVQMHSLIPGSAQNGERFTVPCSSTQAMQITFSGVTYNISHKDYVGKPAAGDAETCSSNVVGRRTFGETQWLVGDVFLKNVYAVFDLDQHRVGFGIKSASSTSGGDSPTPSSSSTPTNSPLLSPSSGSETENTGTGSFSFSQKVHASSWMTSLSPFPSSPISISLDPSESTTPSPTSPPTPPSEDDLFQLLSSLLHNTSETAFHGDEDKSSTSSSLLLPDSTTQVFLQSSAHPDHSNEASSSDVATSLPATSISNANPDDDPSSRAAIQTDGPSPLPQEGAAATPASAANSLLALILALCMAIVLP